MGAIGPKAGARGRLSVDGVRKHVRVQRDLLTKIGSVVSLVCSAERLRSVLSFQRKRRAASSVARWGLSVLKPARDYWRGVRSIAT
jgi:hypothetical protein